MSSPLAELSLLTHRTAMVLLEDLRALQMEVGSADSVLRHAIRIGDEAHCKWGEGESDAIKKLRLATDKTGIGQNFGQWWNRVEAATAARLEDWPGGLPPPMWLRLLPTAIRIALDSWHILGRKNTQCPLRWIAFNVESKNPATRLGATVNVSTNRYSEMFVPVSQVFENNLSLRPSAERNRSSVLGKVRALADYLYQSFPDDDRSGQQGGYLPAYTAYAILVTTAIGGNRYEHQGYAPWVNISANSENRWLSRRSREVPWSEDWLLRDGVPPSTVTVHPPVFDRRFKDVGEAVVSYLNNRWVDHRVAFGDEETAPKLQHYFYYLSNLATQFYPDGQWPSRGMTFMYCPTVFWSPQRDVRGASATVYWGFEGAPPADYLGFLLQQSQTMLAPMGQIARVQDAWDRGIDKGFVDFEQVLGHELSKIYTSASWALETHCTSDSETSVFARDLAQAAMQYGLLWSSGSSVKLPERGYPADHNGIGVAWSDYCRVIAGSAWKTFVGALLVYHHASDADPNHVTRVNGLMTTDITSLVTTGQDYYFLWPLGGERQAKLEAYAAALYRWFMVSVTNAWKHIAAGGQNWNQLMLEDRISAAETLVNSEVPCLLMSARDSEGTDTVFEVSNQWVRLEERSKPGFNTKTGLALLLSAREVKAVLEGVKCTPRFEGVAEEGRWYTAITISQQLLQEQDQPVAE